MNEILLAGLFGAVGGVARAFVGLMKRQRRKKKDRFKPYYLTITLIGAAFIGLFCGLLISTNFALTLLAGYAGIDFIEGVFKAKNRK